MDMERIGLRKVSEFLPLAELTPQSFAVRIPHPVLVLSFSQLPQAHEGGTSSISRKPRKDTFEEFIIALAKRGEQGEGTQSLSIGRGFTSDVVLPFQTVSRLHAALVRDDARAFFLTDHASKNGTFLNGEKLVENHAYAVRDGDRLKFGDVEGRFLEPLSFHRMLLKLWV